MLIFFPSGSFSSDRANDVYSGVVWVLSVPLQVISYATLYRANVGHRLIQYIQIPLQATIFSLLAFFVASAAYRAFRVRSLDSFIMLAVGLIVLLGQVPLGAAIWDKIASAKDWLLSYPTTGGARGIILGAALGAVLTGLRVLLGVDRPHAQ